MRSNVQAAELRVLRLIKGDKRRDRIRSEDIRAERGVKGIQQHVEKMQLKWQIYVNINGQRACRG